jgi:amidohydrolase
VALLCEYDALPGLGHACGHNLIAAMGLGAGLAAARLAPSAGGSLVVIGSPAEEDGGGKVLLAEAGAFDGVDAAMMIHPGDTELVDLPTLACSTWRATYRGVAAHASTYPWKGRNALDAAVLGYNAVAALRQHIEPAERVHGIFLEAGEKPNIVPERAVAEWWVRSPTSAGLLVLNERVHACLRGAATAAGCAVEIESTCPDYFDMWTNAPLAELFSANAAGLGRHPGTVSGPVSVGSTDMGNVSHLVASIHPRIAVSPPGVGIHSAAFAGWAGGPEGDKAVLDGATALAMTVADLWLRPEAMAAARASFEARAAAAGPG